jgi:glycosyltransferase involved in cell wall biosynthesis
VARREVPRAGIYPYRCALTMTLDVSVVIATYGGQQWRTLAHQRAGPSAQALNVPVIYVHAGALAQARNAGLAEVRTERVVFVDADDELEPGYLDAMATGTADVRGPAVRYVQGVKAADPRVPDVPGHDHGGCGGPCLLAGNWLVVGALVSTELLHRVGGWGNEPIYEDWAIWLRCYKAGASFEAIPTAIYRAHVRTGSRNRSLTIAAKNRVHHQILRDVYPEGVPA